MSEPNATSVKLVDGVFEVLAQAPADKAATVRGILDQLIGNDPHAIVRGMIGVPEDLVEVIADGLLDAIESAVLDRLSNSGV